MSLITEPTSPVIPYSKVDYLILCVLDEQLEAIKRIFGLSGPKQLTASIARFYWYGKVTSLHNVEYTVLAACLTDQGNVATASPTALMLAELNPKNLLFVDIAGGIANSEIHPALGDIAVSTLVRYYELQKISPVVKPTTFIAANVSSKLRNILKAVSEKREQLWTDLSLPSRPDRQPTYPRIILGEIACGEKLLGDPESEILKGILEDPAFRQVFAISMEDAGVSRAVYDATANLDEQTHHIHIRAITDFVDKELNQETRNAWKPYCFDVAAHVAYQTVRHSPKHRSSRGRRETKPQNDAFLLGVPLISKQLFVGRHNELSLMREHLRTRSGTVGILTIVGLGGMGKSQLAAKYIHETKRRYDTVAWLNAEDHASLYQSVYQAAKLLSISGCENVDFETLISKVRSWFEQNERWLLVLDNAETITSIIDVIPREGAGSVIITTREYSAELTELGEVVRLSKWSEQESLIYLQKRIKVKDVDEALKLADELDGLPIAFAFAASYMIQDHCSLHDYLGRLSDRKVSLLVSSPRLLSYRKGFGVAWDLSFEKMERDMPGTADLMRLCSFMAPDNIPTDLLRQGSRLITEIRSGGIPKNILRYPYLVNALLKDTSRLDSRQVRLLESNMSDASRLSQMLSAVTTHSLGHRRDDNLWLHRLVQEVTLHRMSSEQAELWREYNVLMQTVIYADAWDEDEEGGGDWPDYRCLVPHSRSVLRASEAAPAQPSLPHLGNYVGLQLYTWGELEQARNDFREALLRAEEAFGASSIATWDIRNQVALIEYEFDNFNEASEHWEKNLKIINDSGDSDPEPMITTCVTYGWLLMDYGRLEYAYELLKKAIDLSVQLYPKGDRRLAVELVAYGDVLRALGRAEEARGFLEEAIGLYEGRKQEDVEDDPLTQALCVYGEVLERLGDRAGAKTQYERALRIDILLYGASHINIARDEYQLGSLLIDEGDNELGRQHVERARHVYIELLGADHRDVEKCTAKLHELDRCTHGKENALIH